MAFDPFKNFKSLNSKPAVKSKVPVTRSDNFVESVKDIGSATLKSLKNDVVKGTAQNIFDQLLGSARTGSVPTTPDQAITPDLEKMIAEREKAAADEARGQERAFHQQKARESQVLFSFADEKVKNEINGVRQELAMLVQTMGQVEQQVEMAIMDNIADGGVYHLNYFHKLKSWIIFMRKSLEDASLWLSMSKGRKGKGYFWTQVGQSGTKYSMSHERAVQMGAG